MNLQEKQEKLEDIIEQISTKGHNESLLQELIRCYCDIYLAKNYQNLGNCIDTFCNCTSENLDSDFFAQIIKPKAYVGDKGLADQFLNSLCSHIRHWVVMNNESLSQVYTNLGLLGKDNQTAQFWWNSTVNALTEFPFKDLCKVISIKPILGEIYFILEKNLKMLLMEKGIPEDSYTINYGILYGSQEVLECELVDKTDDAEWMEYKVKYSWAHEEFEYQTQKGLHISRKPQKRI